MTKYLLMHKKKKELRGKSGILYSCQARESIIFILFYWVFPFHQLFSFK